MKKLLFLFIATGQIFAQVKISKLDYKTDNNFGVVTINYTGELKSTPELMIKDDIVQVSIPNSIVWPKIENKVTVNNSFDSTLMAYQYTKDLVRVRAALPYKLNGKENQVSIIMGDQSLSLYFPKVQVASNKKNVQRALNIAATKEENEESSKYDESYLNKLLKDKPEQAKVVAKEEESLKTASTAQTTNLQNTDKVSTNMSGVEKSGFNVSGYVVKFIGFFSLLIAGIYFVMNFFRKGVLKKAGLGFFSSEKMIEVLSTTYIAPKRSLMVVRAGKQLFLVAQSEKGMDYLTEIKDTASFIKESEKEILGSNFDTNLEQAAVNQKEFKLKDMVTEVADKVEFKNAPVATQVTTEKKEKSNFSKQIKSKIKDLKQFQ